MALVDVPVPHIPDPPTGADLEDALRILQQRVLQQVGDRRVSLPSIPAMELTDVNVRLRAFFDELDPGASWQPAQSLDGPEIERALRRAVGKLGQ